MGGGVKICVCRENAEVVEIICSAAIVAVSVLELAKVVQRSDLL